MCFMDDVSYWQGKAKLKHAAEILKSLTLIKSKGRSD